MRSLAVSSFVCSVVTFMVSVTREHGYVTNSMYKPQLDITFSFFHCCPYSFLMVEESVQIVLYLIWHSKITKCSYMSKQGDTMWTCDLVKRTRAPTFSSSDDPDFLFLHPPVSALPSSIPSLHSSAPSLILVETSVYIRSSGGTCTWSEANSPQRRPQRRPVL